MSTNFDCYIILSTKLYIYFIQFPNIYLVLPYEAVPFGQACWKDGSPRAIPTLEGKSRKLVGHYKRRQNSVQQCYNAAKAKGFQYFAVQDGGQCMSSATAGNDYQKYGKSRDCTNSKGGPMANFVYRIKNGMF